jgi:hypothetical protein
LLIRAAKRFRPIVANVLGVTTIAAMLARFCTG